MLIATLEWKKRTAFATLCSIVPFGQLRINADAQCINAGEANGILVAFGICSRKCWLFGSRLIIRWRNKINRFSKLGSLLANNKEVLGTVCANLATSGKVYLRLGLATGHRVKNQGRSFPCRAFHPSFPCRPDSQSLQQCLHSLVPRFLLGTAVFRLLFKTFDGIQYNIYIFNLFTMNLSNLF